LFFWIGDFEILFLIHLLVKKHEALSCIIVFDVLRRLIDVLVSVWSAAIELVNVVIVVGCQEKGKRDALKHPFIVVQVKAMLAADGRRGVPVGDQTNYLLHSVFFNVLKSPRPKSLVVLALLYLQSRNTLHALLFFKFVQIFFL
jgi:hypothetical protein